MDRIRSNLGVLLVIPLVVVLGLAASSAVADPEDACGAESAPEPWPQNQPHHAPAWGTASGTTQGEPAEDPVFDDPPFSEGGELEAVGGPGHNAWNAATSVANSNPENDWSGHFEGWACDGGEGPPGCPDGFGDCPAGSEVFVGGNTGGSDPLDLEEGACLQASVRFGDGPEGAEVVVKPGENVEPDVNTTDAGDKQRCSNRGNSSR